MNEFDLTFQAYNLLDELKASPEYQNVILSYQRLREDPETSLLIQNFNIKKSKYEEVVSYGKHHPDYQKVSTAFIEAKTNLYSSPLYKEYMNLLRIFNESIQGYNEQLNRLLQSVVIDSEKSCMKG